MPGKQLFANNAKGKLNAGILAGDVQLTVQAGQGALFPAPAGTDWYLATLIDAAGNIEIIKCTARAADNFNPIVRAQEGTVARAFIAGDKVELRWTRDSANQFQQRTDVQRNIARFAGVVGGAADALTATIASDLTALQDGLRVDAEALLANLTTTPTLNLTLGATVIGALTIKKLNAAALGAGDMAGVGHRLMFEYRAADNSWILLNPAGALNRAIISVRQAIQAAALDANGYNAAFAAGTGLAVNLAATATPLNVSFANGFDSGGPFELSAQLGADVASAVSSLASSNTSYLHATWTGLSAVTWSKCLVPPQYGYAFDRAQAAILNLEGVNGSGATTDDFGNSWALTTATITTAQFKFGTSSLDCTGGAAKYVRTTGIATLGDGSWEISCWFRINALPGVGASAELISFQNAAFVGARVLMSNTAGTTKLSVQLSSDGTSTNIANGLGANTVWALNQWNKLRLVFDALAGTYRVYLSLNAAAETQDFTVSSSARVCGLTEAAFGRNVGAAANQFDGWFDAIRFVRCATNTSPETPSASAPTVADFPVHYFSIPKMQMFEVTAANALPAGDPVLTQRNRTFVGEADTGAAAVAAVRNYAVRAQYRSSKSTPVLAVSSSQSYNHNIGVPFDQAELWMECLTSENGYNPGDRILFTTSGNASWASAIPIRASRNTASIATQQTTVGQVPPKTGGAAAALTLAFWALQLVAERGW